MQASHSVKQTGDTWEDMIFLRYGMRHSKTPRENFVRSAAGPLSTTSDHLFPMTVLTSMVTKDPVLIEGSVSPKLYANFGKIQEILSAFVASHKQTVSPMTFEVEKVEETELPEKRGTAMFYSGGVDSLYSALRHQHELDALIFIRGQDIDVRDDDWRDLSTIAVRGSAEYLGIPLIELDADINRFIGRASAWPVGYGCSLATVALLLQPLFSKILVCGGRSMNRLTASGAHPLLDPLWSTEGLEVVHEGAEAERWEKIKFLLDQPLAHKHLRMCFERSSAPFNCGECNKCLTTMATIDAFGALDRFETFAKPLDYERVAGLDSGSATIRLRIEDTLSILNSPDARPNPELRAALIRSLERRVDSLTTDFGEPVTVS